MKKIFSLLTIIFIVVSITQAQIKPIHFKKLQEFLPTMELKDLKRGKPTGATQTVMGFATSEASVQYSEIVKESANNDPMFAPEPKSIKIKISDAIGIPYMLAGFMYMQEYENETEDGYEKSVLINNRYKGKEEAQTGETKSCRISFAVANRYSVELEASGISDSQLLHKLINSMKLEDLEKLTDTK